MTEQESLKNIRNRHLADILKELRIKGERSLAELTECTDGGLTTVTKCVTQAMEYGMISEGSIAESTGGRKARRYLINKEYQYFLFIIVDNNYLYCKVCDFGYGLVEEYNVHFKIDEYMEAVYSVIDRAKGKYDVGTVCLSIPCVVKDGVILEWYYNRRMQGFNIKKDIEERYMLNVIVQNDMKLTVTGESAKRHDGIKDIVAVQFVHNGLGVAAMVNGQLLEGSAGFAGEVGFTNDLRKNIKGISYPAKIVRNTVIYINPALIVFYKSDRDVRYEEIFNVAMKGLPSFAIPKFEISGDYLDSIMAGLKLLVDMNGFFKKN